ncbi:transporter substrate-binding domain-containing protein [Undibacterium cyanobacteriorum]|uniref:Transporter substrate-binding domain-containing protein n=1 Tax=Undibacterium cyanobacteriorum TaxID=3073561 RepID=A0ABY9RLA0_9BURK|nr:transporter substrate-binding domain-containing protein [Undibacterium sp. 20NA77.5]WMW81995.1 transporter substrate-binding domain-containing protein [Undibacterium sp. 20NA77.5]
MGFSSTSWSATLEVEHECGQIRVGLLEIGALFYRLPDGRFSGIDQDILEALALRTNCQFKPRVESQARIWSQIREASLDMSMSGIKTIEREEWATSVPYFSTRNYALISTSLSAQEQTAAGFLANKNLKMAVIKGFQHGRQYNDFVTNLRHQNRIYEVADFASLIKLLQVKRVHGILIIPTSYIDLSRQKQLPESTVLRDWYPNDAFVAGLYISKRTISPKSVQMLQTALNGMQADGTLERIFARYVGDKLAKEMLLDPNQLKSLGQ